MTVPVGAAELAGPPGAGNIQAVLDGELDAFIHAYLRSQGGKK